MGCAQSRLENEEAVMRCKDRKNFIKEAVSERNAFTASHSAYAIALKDTGAGLSDYGHGEAEIRKQDNHHPEESSLGSAETTPMDSAIIQPPPPPPNFSPSPLQRHMSMPDFSQKQPNRKNLEPINITITEEQDEQEDKGSFERNRKQGGKPSPPPPPPPPPSLPQTPPTPPLTKAMTWDYFFPVAEMEEGSFDGNEEEDDEEDDFEDPKDVDGGGGVGEQIDVVIEPKTPERVVEKVEETPPPLNKKLTVPTEFRNAVCGSNMLQILSLLDDHFLKASQSAQEVSKLLEANGLHFHSNFADNGGHMDHSARVMRVITWNRSIKANGGAGGGHDDPDSVEYETHATVLDKLLAWEKKLYDEVKAGEMMKAEYSRKIKVLSKQKKRGVSADSLEKTKAAVSHLHTRYIVDMQSLDSTVVEVNHLRDHHLYQKLVSLVKELEKMWGTMLVHHRSQLKVALDLKSVESSQAPKETTREHHQQTIQLMKVVEQWHLQFDQMVTHQKHYIGSLHSWLKLNLIPIESSGGSTGKQAAEKTPLPPLPPIHALLTAWQDLLQNPQDDLTKAAIGSFAAVIKTIVDHQVEEMKLKDRCEDTRKEYLRKERSFEKYMRCRDLPPPQEAEEENTPTEDASTTAAANLNLKDPVLERRFVVVSLKKRLDEEVAEHQRHCIQVRDKSLGCLKIRLPELFRAMWDYTHSASDIYQKLSYIAMPNQISPPP